MSGAPVHRIVIVGGGAGGLELATRLGDRLGRRGRVEVTLIDRNRTHVWKPKLHEIAAGSMDMSAHEVDYLAQSHWHHFRYRSGVVCACARMQASTMRRWKRRASPCDSSFIACAATPGVPKSLLWLPTAITSVS